MWIDCRSFANQYIDGGTSSRDTFRENLLCKGSLASFFLKLQLLYLLQVEQQNQ